MQTIEARTYIPKLEIHTSDRILFKRCRRKWDLSSLMRQYIEPRDGGAIHFWFGTGFHFAQEDYHGYNRFGDPRRAFLAYCGATKRVGMLPAEWEAYKELADATFTHYIDIWLPERADMYETLWLKDGKAVRPHTLGAVPQVEVKWSIDVNGVPYVGTFDRVVTDKYGQWWVLDYKTAKAFNVAKLATDPQVTAYTWAAEKMYGHLFEGVVYMQFVKSTPEQPNVLKSGELSKNKAQSTTYALYRNALLERYPTGEFPAEYRDVLAYFESFETPEGDKFIRWDTVRRNSNQLLNVEQHIKAEIEEMTNPNLAIYPNPTSDCTWDCDFRTLCLAMDDGGDVEWLMESAFQQRTEFHGWEKEIKWPAAA